MVNIVRLPNSIIQLFHTDHTLDNNFPREDKQYDDFSLLLISFILSFPQHCHILSIQSKF